MVGKAQAVQTVEAPYTVDYPIKVGHTLVGAEAIVMKGSTGNLNPPSKMDIKGKNTT